MLDDGVGVAGLHRAFKFAPRLHHVRFQGGGIR
jgi:hypothetical protein